MRELRQRDGFEKTSIHARRQTTFALVLLRRCREPPDDKRRITFSDLAGKLNTIHNRHIEIGNQQVIISLLKIMQCHLAIVGFISHDTQRHKLTFQE